MSGSSVVAVEENTRGRSSAQGGSGRFEWSRTVRPDEEQPQGPTNFSTSKERVCCELIQIQIRDKLLEELS